MKLLLHPCIRLPGTLKARAILILCCIFLISHTVNLVIYETNREQAIILTEATDLAARIVGIVNLARSFPTEDRQQILAAAETQFLGMYPALTDLHNVACQDNTFSQLLSENISANFANLPGLDAEVCVRSASSRGFDVLVSISFPDNKRAAFHAVLPQAGSLFQDTVLIYLVVTGFIALFLAWYLIRKAIAPLERLAAAADEIGVNIDSPPLNEDGPQEVARAARAFNHMQLRLARLVHGQTDMLAAISHDLRSAITRLQLRAELLKDDHEREGLLRVVEDMRLMVESVLAFVRGYDPNETPRKINMTALVESLCEDLQEEGYPVTYECDDQSHILLCRPTSLRRSFQNVINNAIKYAGNAQVKVGYTAPYIVISIEDNGPGIPDDKLETVLRPFYRLEKSRSQDTGGVGLGLAITQNIVQAHGGIFTLSNRREGGLRVEIKLACGGGSRTRDWTREMSRITRIWPS